MKAATKNGAHTQQRSLSILLTPKTPPTTSDI